MARVTAIAELPDEVTPGAVFAATNTRIHLWNEVIDGDVLIVDNGSRVVAVARVNDYRIERAARSGEISASANFRMRGGVATVTDVTFVRDRGSAAWVEGQHRDDLNDVCRYWKPRVALASMAAMGEPALTIPVGSRPPGDRVCRLEIRGDITFDTGEALESKIRAAAGQSIDLQIDSEGGDINAAWGVWRALGDHDQFVAANIAGCALSAAVIPLLAADTRTAEHDAQIMVHQPYITTLHGQAFNADALRRVADDVANETRHMVRIIAARTGNDWDIVREWVERETKLDAAQALQLGFVHQVLHDQAPRFPVARRARFAPINGPYTVTRKTA